MNKYLIIFFLLPCILSAQEEVKITTVDSVDINKYVGTWFEIAKIPNSFQKHCAKNTTATYKINEDGDIEVLNRCIDDDGEVDDADGIARIVDKTTNSKLEVSFVSFFGWRPFWGDYWILGLDKEYQYAVIGTPSKKYGWILSRTPQMNEQDLGNCFKIFENNGYNRYDFELSVQEY